MNSLVNWIFTGILIVLFSFTAVFPFSIFVFMESKENTKINGLQKDRNL